MNIGSLVKYYSMDEKVVYGVITKYHENDGPTNRKDGPAVQVCWMDDGEITFELVKNLCDPDVEWLQVVSSV